MRIESDVIKTASIIVLLVGVYVGAVFWPSQRHREAMAEEVVIKQAQLSQMKRPDLTPILERIDCLRVELRDRSVVLPKGALDDRVLQHVSDTLIQHGVTLYETSYRQTKTFMRFAITPIDVRFESNFTTAFEIIKQIENAGPPLRIERLKLIGSEDDRTGQVQVAIELSSFFEPLAAQGDNR